MAKKENAGGGHAALTQLQAYLAQSNLPEASKLPPERELCEQLGVSRGDLRKALSVLEQEGRLWRHVGKGTFLGRPQSREAILIADIATRTNPSDVMRARLVLEPSTAADAALHASQADIEAMRRSLRAMRSAQSWRQFENLDNLLHRQIAEATRNTALLGIFDVLNSIRRTVFWGRMRLDEDRPPVDHHSFADHERIVEAIAQRDMACAANAMRSHLKEVERRLLLATALEAAA